MTRALWASFAALAAGTGPAIAQQRTSKLDFIWETWWWIVPLLLVLHFGPDWALSRYAEKKRVSQPDWQLSRAMNLMKTLLGPVVVVLIVVPYLYFRTK